LELSVVPRAGFEPATSGDVSRIIPPFFLAGNVALLKESVLSNRVNSLVDDQYGRREPKEAYWQML
jgi:hypothetical protein